MAKTDAISDDALLSAIAAGDADAFAVFVRRHHGAVKRYLATRLADRDAVDDVMQDTLVALFRSAGSYAGTSTPKAWLFGIARNRAARHARKRVGEPSNFEELNLGELAMRAGWGETPRAEAALELSRVHEALDRLPDDMREILVMRDVEGMTNPEVAAVLDLKIPAVKSRVHRARLALMAELHEEMPS